MSVMGFKNLDGEWLVGGVSSIQFYFRFLDYFNFAKPLSNNKYPVIIFSLITSRKHN